MVELLIILAMFGWLVVATVEFLSSLAAFPTIVTATLVVPPAALALYRRLAVRNRLEFLRDRRGFLPPERFYWPGQARVLRWQLGGAFTGTVVAWPVALLEPARWAADSWVGWLAGAAAIVSTTLLMSLLALYLRASQRFDKFTPAPIGWARRTMFWLSDNHEFLDEEPELPRKKTKESVY